MSARKLDIRIAPEADDDLKSIAMYTSQHWGEAQATIYEAMIGESLESLREHPLLGHSRDDLFPGCRSVRVERHVLYYHQPHPDYIEVVRILHSRQNPAGNVAGPSS